MGIRLAHARQRRRLELRQVALGLRYGPKRLVELSRGRLALAEPELEPAPPGRVHNQLARIRAVLAHVVEAHARPSQLVRRVRDGTTPEDQGRGGRRERLDAPVDAAAPDDAGRRA